MTSVTRNKTKLRIIDNFPENIKSNVLPTYEGVLRHYEWLRFGKEALKSSRTSGKTYLFRSSSSHY